ncbi:MAG: alpha/beta hydrolase [Leucobacter sp.]
MNRLTRAFLRLFAAPRLDVRRDYEKMRRFQRLAAAPVPRYRTLDRAITSEDGSHDIPVRVFLPKERRREDVILFFHGGGWVTGDIESYTPACTTMADLTGCVVASVDYRLAPEHPFPAGLEDCLRVARLVLEEPGRVGLRDAERVVLVGDSAGGNLAAVASQVLRDEGISLPRRQILLYPVTHWDHDAATSLFGTVRDHGDDYRLTNTEIQEYMELYVPDPEMRRSPLVSPLMAEDLSSQPKTLMLTAELDLLRDEGEAYGEALAKAGNDVRVNRIPGALHGFIALPRFARPLRESYDLINAFLDEDGEDRIASTLTGSDRPYDPEQAT